MYEGITAFGHFFLKVSNLENSIAFYRDTLGLKHVVKSDFFNAFELAGHTHLCIMPGKPSPGDVGFDFLAGDIDSVHDQLKEAGVNVTNPSDDAHSHHRWFQVTDPDGHKFSVMNNSHENMN